MPPLAEREPCLRHPNSSSPGRNNNAFGRKRERQTKDFLQQVRIAAATHFVQAGIYEEDERARRRLNELAKRGRLHAGGYVMLFGQLLKTWYFGNVSQREHELEMTDLTFCMHVDDILRGLRIPKDLRLAFAFDGLILIDGEAFGLEHDRGTEEMEFVAEEKMRKLADCPFNVLWTCPNNLRAEHLLAIAPNDRHFFTTFELARTPHEPVWQNNTGEVVALKRSTTVRPNRGTAGRCLTSSSRTG